MSRSHDPDFWQVTPLESFPPIEKWDDWAEGLAVFPRKTAGRSAGGRKPGFRSQAVGRANAAKRDPGRQRGAAAGQTTHTKWSWAPRVLVKPRGAARTGRRRITRTRSSC